MRFRSLASTALFLFVEVATTGAAGAVGTGLRIRVLALVGAEAAERVVRVLEMDCCSGILVSEGSSRVALDVDASDDDGFDEDRRRDLVDVEEVTGAFFSACASPEVFFSFFTEAAGVFLGTDT